MEKNIYGLLNEVKTDLTEYEAAELSGNGGNMQIK